jgi:hypothetical protein
MNTRTANPQDFGYKCFRSNPVRIWAKDGKFFFETDEWRLVEDLPFNTIEDATEAFEKIRCVRENTTVAKERTLLEEIEDDVDDIDDLNIQNVLSDIVYGLKELGPESWAHIEDAPMFVGVADKVIGPQEDISSRVGDNEKVRSELRFIANAKTDVPLLCFLVAKLMKIIQSDSIIFTDNSVEAVSERLEKLYVTAQLEMDDRRVKYEKYHKQDY